MQRHRAAERNKANETKVRDSETRQRGTKQQNETKITKASRRSRDKSMNR